MKLNAIPKPLIVLLSAFVVLCLVYAYATPIFESPDELYHFGMVQEIASTGQLPVQVVGKFPPWGQEGSQPPLYYLIAAILVRPIDRSDYDQVRQQNPHAIIGVPGAFGNKNLVLHDYPPPLHGTTLAVYVARLLSIMLGAVTVSAVYASARILAPDQWAVALLAAGITAFNPQFIFISSSVNNDNMVTALNSLVIWQMLLMLRDGFQTRRSALIAVLVALATISKLSGLVVALVVVLAALWVGYHRRGWRGLFTLGALMAGCWLLLGAWWYVRNLTLYGELFGTQTMLDIFGRRPAPALQQLLTSEFEGLRISYWGLFGWFNVFTFRPFYVIMDILTLAGVIGLLLYFWRIRRDRDRGMRVLFLMLIIAIGGISLISWTSQTAASQGRLLFPYIVASSCLLALGLSTLRIPARLVAIPLGLFALVVPFATIMPEYMPPTPLTQLPATTTPIYARFGDVELVGYETPDRRYGPGDEVPITLYWKPLRKSDLDYSLFVHLLDPSDQVLVKLPTYPGFGRLRTTSWEPGFIYPDSYPVYIPKDATGHYQLRVNTGWWKYPEGFSIDPVDENNQPLGSVIFSAGSFVSGDDSAVKVANSVVPVDFGKQIRLVAYELDGQDLTLMWETIGAMNEDFTVLAIVLADDYQVGGENVILAQGDSPPPLPTRYWRFGERFVTHHHLSFSGQPAAGEYPVYVGWYSTLYPARLQADCPDNACFLTTISVP